MELKTGFCRLNPSECLNASKERWQKGFLNLPKWYILQYGCKHSTWLEFPPLKFLHRVATNEERICHHAFSAMVDNVDALRLCKELEKRYKLSFTSQLLNAKEPAAGLEIIRNAQRHINVTDLVLLLDKVSVSAQDWAGRCCGITHLIMVPQSLKV